ncbi:MAG: hypothetical protein ACLP9K_10095 [Nitrososphaerales archaeon]|jgi:hypothetical protein
MPQIRISMLLLTFAVIIVGASVPQVPFVIGQSASASINQVAIQVTYSGSWQGAYGVTGTSSSMVSWSGNGTKSVTLSRPSGGGVWAISANAQKLDGSSASLVIEMLAPNGTVLQEAQTIAPYGMAQIGFTVSETTYSGTAIPEFPAQPGMALLATTVVITSYVLARRAAFQP